MDNILYGSIGAGSFIRHLRKIYVSTCLTFSDEIVYSKGLMAELTGSMKTMVHAYTSPGNLVPCNAINPKKIATVSKNDLW